MQDCKDIHSFVSAFTGSHHYIMDYLTEEVLKLQPERVRTFLLQTSILTSMCGSLCDAVVEPEEYEPRKRTGDAGDLRSNEPVRHPFG